MFLEPGGKEGVVFLSPKSIEEELLGAGHDLQEWSKSPIATTANDTVPPPALSASIGPGSLCVDLVWLGC